LISLEDLRPDRRPGEPTARELFAIMRRIRDGEPYDDLVAGFSDYDYGPTGSARRPPRRLTPEPHRWVGTEQLLREHAHEPAMVDGARAKLVATAQRYMDTNGYASTSISWEMLLPDDPHGLYLVRLEVDMAPRHDGEWDAIRAAIEEDEADRAEAAAGRTAVNDRLDALATAAAVWSNPSLRESFQAVGKAATGLSEALRRTSVRPIDRR
jgi:hypothetical protein